jgi:hypothetical protein
VTLLPSELSFVVSHLTCILVDSGSYTGSVTVSILLTDPNLLLGYEKERNLGKLREPLDNVFNVVNHQFRRN